MSPGRHRSVVVVFLSVLTVLAASWPLPVQAGNAGFHFSKTVSGAAISPVLTLTLAVDHASAIPGDVLTYSGKVANTGDSWGITGRFTAESHNDADASVASWWDEIQYCLSGCGNGLNKHWTALAGAAGVAPGYSPATPADISTGLQLTAVGRPASGVVYPTAGDPLLGTTVAAGSTAIWDYTTTVSLTPSQVALLADPTQVQVVRNVAHLETSGRNFSAAQPWTDSAIVTNGFQAAAAAGNATAVIVNLTEPGGTVVRLDSTAVPGFASIPPGGIVSYSTRFTVPVPAAKGANETDAAYLQRLSNLDGAALTASATLTATGSAGATTAPPPAPVTTIEHLPVLGIVKRGPTTIDAGTTETNPLAISNSGSAPASNLAVLDSVPGGATGAVSGLPATLAATTSTNASAAFPIPVGQPAGPLTDTAALTWTDANGNAYGPVSSSFTTAVHNNFFGASLTLTPAVAGPNKPGTTQTLTAKLLDKAGVAMANQPLTFTVTGVNPGTGSATTDSGGMASFTYTGNNVGNDVAQATVNVPGVNLASNTSSISWVLLLQPVAMTPVTGNFFTNTGPSCTFLPGPLTMPVFSQQFPDILFNPATAQVPHNISRVTQTTRPFTDLTTDVNGNYNGTIVAQDQSGNVAGMGSLGNFYSELTGSFVIQQAGDVTLTITHADGYLLGVGGGATRVSGAFEGNPPATTPFNSYPTVAAFNQASAPLSDHDTIHFPAPGVYPFEIDYTQCGPTALTLVVQLATFNAQTSPLSVYVGYADGLRGPGSIFPFPWEGSPDVTFVGGGVFDSGAIRFDNSGDTPITFDTVTVDVGRNASYNIWPHSLVVPAHKILILAQTNGENFDSSDVNGTGCGQDSGIKPVVHLTTGTTTTDFTDTQEILNTHGFDSVCLGNESESWVRIGGGGTAINVPLPPAGTLNLTPFNVPNAIQGQPLALTVAAMDGSGNAVANLPISLQIFGANARILSANTDVTGLAHFTYTGVSGKDTLIATGFVSGLREVSNTGTVVWAPPVGGGPNPNPDPNAPPAPTIGPLSIADGSIVTKPATVSATVTPPGAESITSWRVFYQALDPGPLVVIGSGIGAPPAPPAVLATFDPTVLVNDGYSITLEATASNGGIQDVTSSVTVLGNLKLGRYTTTYQDLSVPVNGFQMEVRRTYDSIDKSSGDFGAGWRVSVSNFRTAPNRILGAAGWTQYNKSCTLGLCFTAFKNAAARFVSVTFPDQHTEVFDFAPNGGTNLFWECRPAFTARAGTGTTSTLRAVDETSCSYTGDGNLYGSSGLYAPKRFQLTTVDGRVLELDVNLGLVSEADRNGNTLSIDASGLHSATGGSITFTRDLAGRITTVTGPSGHSMSYTYSASNDLSAYNDANGNTTTFTYDAGHGLLTASGVGGPLQTLHYDASGRLTSYTDGGGNTTAISQDVAGQKQVVTDATGALTTVYTMDDLGDIIRTDATFGGQTLTSTATYDLIGRPLTRTDPLGHSIAATYDGSGNLLSFTDKAGSASAGSYDSFGALTSVTDQLGNSSQLQYSATGNLTTLTNSLGQSTHFVHDAKGKRTQRTDALGQIWNYAYDAAGNEISETDPLGQTTHLTYDASGRLTSVQNALGATNRFTYDGNGNLLTVTDPLGAVATNTYDALNHRITQTDALGKVTSYTYDGAGNLVTTNDPLGNRTSSTYDADGRLLSGTDPLGRTTRYGYDGAGQLVTETLPNGGTLGFSYDAAGRKVSAADALAHTTSFGYDATGRMISTTDPLGNVSHKTFDAKGRVTQDLDALGQAKHYTYDSEGKVLVVTDPMGATTTNAYDADGRVISTTDPLGHKTTYVYDGAGRQVTSTDALGRTTTLAYDALGELTFQKLPSGLTTTYTYDGDGHRLSTTDALGDVARSSYDAVGRLVGVTDPRGNATTFGFDAAGRQVSSTDALGGVVRTTYDAGGEQTSVSNPRGDTTRFAYDSLGSVVRKTDPSGGVMTYTYDAAGRRTTSVDPRGVSESFGYDAAGNQTTIAFPGGTISLAYDALGQRTSMTDPTGQTTFAYDAAGRTTSVASPEGLVSYAYDAAGRRTSMTIPNARTLTYGYDAANQLTSLVDWPGQTTIISHDADGRWTAVNRPAGLVTSYSYDAAGRLVGLNNDGPAGALLHFSYTLDASGNRTSVTSSNGTESYILDALNRTTHATYTNADSVGYTYDAAGNRTSVTTNGTTSPYTYDAGGKLVLVGGTTLTYDAAGNLASAGTDTFSYDWSNRLVASTTSGTSSTYRYDGTDVRVGMTSGASTSTYLWDRLGSVPTLVDDGTHSFVQVGRPLEQLDTGGAATALYPLTDALGSVRGVAGAAGNVVGTAGYDIFGATRTQAGAKSVLGFTGEQSDPATGFVYLRARYLDPTRGRFLTPDSVQPNAPGSQGYNGYSYAANNPGSRLDPSGHLTGEYVAIVDSEASAFTYVATAAEQAAADAAGAEAEATFFAARCLMLAVSCAQALVDLAGLLEAARILSQGACAGVQCAPAGSDSTEPGAAPAGGPEPAPGADVVPDPISVSIKDKPRIGMKVYRVWQYPGGRWYGIYWTPVDPTTLGPQRYRFDAGLPDVETLGNCLVSGTLVDTNGVIATQAAAVDWPHAYGKYPGGLLEYQIPSPPFQVGNRHNMTLVPPYGGDPSKPRQIVPACPAQV